MNLKQQQSQMLSAIFSLESLQENRIQNTSDAFSAGLSIYQHSLLANANRALAITFATVHSFVGETGFSQLVKAYLQKHLKTQFDWGELGDDFANFIQQQSLPNSDVLAAIATLDFACHHAERAENVEKNLATLSLLNDVDAYQLRLNFSAGFKVIKLDYPADLIITEITNAHENSNDSKLTLSDIAKQLSRYEKGQYHLLVWRPNFQAQYQQITQQEYQWLALWQSAVFTENIESSMINEPLSIGGALDKINHEEFSIVAWLPQAIEQQLIHSVSVLAPS
jgi:hypothetical protein